MKQQLGLWSTRDLLRLALFLGIGTVCLVLAVQSVDLGEVAATLRGASIWLVGVALLVNIVNLAAKSLRWGLMLATIPQSAVFQAFMVGQFLNSVLPVRAGEVARVYFAQRHSQVTTAQSIGSVVLEKLVDSAALLAAIAIALPLAPLPDGLRFSGIWLSVALTVVLVTVVAFAVIPPLRRLAIRALDGLLGTLQRTGVPVAWTDFGRRQMRNLVQSLEVSREPRQAVGILLLTAVAWGTGALTNLLVFRALGVEVGWNAAKVVLIVLLVGASIPSLPGKFGTFHYLTVVALLPFAVEQDVALAVAIVLHLVVFAPMWAIGAVAFFSGAGRPSPGRPDEAREQVGATLS